MASVHSSAAARQGVSPALEQASVLKPWRCMTDNAHVLCGRGRQIRTSLMTTAVGLTALLGIVVPNALAANASYAGASSDGSRVFFTTADKLVSGDVDGGRVDVYQRAGGKTTLISTRSGAAADNGAFNAVYGGSTPDGQHVFFTTGERLVPADQDNSVDVYERTGATTTLISPGNGHFDARFAGASADGKHVFFMTAEKLSSADTDTSVDVYDRNGTVTTLVSRGQIHGNGHFDATFTGSSSDGTKVFFETSESLASTDTDSRRDVYERANGSTTQISRGQINGNGPIKASFKGTSTNGNVVFFQTAEELAPTDTDTNVDIYRRAGGTTTEVSRGQVNGNGAFDAAYRGSTPTGSAVFFVTKEPLASTDTDTANDVYERAGSTTTLISQGPKHSNGHFDAVFDAVSTDGSRVLFSTDAGLVDTDKDRNADVYVRTGPTTPHPATAILSQNPDTGSNGPFDARFTGASTDGRIAFFESDEGLTPQAFDGGHMDVFSGTMSSLSLDSSGGSAPLDASYGGASANGARVFFTTAERLVPADTDNSVDVYQHAAGVTTLVSTG
jgi:hypothetical protein